MSSIEYINSVVLTDSATSVTFSGIPADWTDLRLVMSLRTDATGTEYAGLVLNSDTGSNYSTTHLSGNGSTAGSGRYSTGSGLNNLFSSNLDIEATAGVWSVFAVDVMSYANTSVYKTALVQQSTPGVNLRSQVSLWQSTAAITSIQVVLYTSGKNFVTGSTFTLWGVK